MPPWLRTTGVNQKHTNVLGIKFRSYFAMTVEPPSILWTPENEVCLFYAMRGQKPTGVNKHFHMLCIHKKFCESYGQQASSGKLWEHLNTMYNMKALDESEICPIKTSTLDFALPSEILNYKNYQTRDSLNDSLADEESSNKSSKGRKRARASPAPVPSKHRRR